MGLTSGRVTSRLLNVPYLQADAQFDNPDRTRATVLDVLARLPVFTPIDPKSMVERSVGFCGFGDPFLLDTTPTALFGERFLLGLRIDTLKVPASYLKARVAAEERALCVRQGRTKLVKRERDDLRLQVTQEVRASTLPTMRHVQIVVDADRGTIRVLTAAPTVVMLVAELWEKASQMPFQMHGAISVAADVIDALVGYVPCPDRLHLIGEGSGFEPGPCIPTFLGAEFLTWLCWRSERDNGDIKTDPNALPVTHATVFFEQSLLLCDTHGAVARGRETVAVHTDSEPLSLEEAREAFRMGKQVASARLRLDTDEHVYEFSIDDDLQLSSVKLPQAPPADADVSGADAMPAVVADRLELLRVLESTVDDMYRDFLALRCDRDAWGAERAGLHKWVTRQED